MPKQKKDQEFTLWGNVRVTIRQGENSEILIRSEDGARGFSINRAADGPAGFGIDARTPTGSPPMTVLDNDDPDSPHFDTKNIALCQYRQDARSQAFKQWYTDPDNNEYPDKTLGAEAT